MSNLLNMPDSRLAGHHGRVTHPHLDLERTYCINCGKPKGWVRIEDASAIRAGQIIVVCDDCAATIGDLPLLKADIKEYGGT